MRYSGLILVVLAGGIYSGWANEAHACGFYVPNFLPADGSTNVPTNSSLIVTTKTASPWLRKLVADIHHPELIDAGKDESAGALDAGTDVELGETRCVEREYAQVCMTTANLEPNTRYAWGAAKSSIGNDTQTFVTGSGPRTPSPLPGMTLEVGAPRHSFGAGDCATYRAARVTVKFEASADPWLLVSGNPLDYPHFVLPGETEASWETLDYEGCFGLEQMNFLGEVVVDDHEVCIEEPGPDSGLSNDEATHTEETNSPPIDSDASVKTPRRNVEDRADASDTDGPQHKHGATAPKERGGCNLCVGTGSSLVPGLSMFLLGLVFMHRRRRRLVLARS